MKRRYLLLLAMIFSSSVLAEVRYVTSIEAKLLTDPSFKAEVVSVLSKGTQIESISKKGVWLEVKVDDQTGWVSKFLTKTSPPTERITVLPGDKETTLKDVRRRTSAITTAAAARGLAASSRGDESDKFASDPKAVEYMESMSMDDDTLSAFAQPIQQGVQ